MSRQTPLQTGFGPAVSGDEALPSSPVVLLLVDFINPLSFDGAELLAPPALAAAQATAVLKDRLGGSGVRAIYVNDNFGQWRSDFRMLVSQCRRRQGASAQLVRQLAPAAEDLAVLKPRHSGFHATPLDLLLLQLGTRQVIITGLATDYCVMCTAMDAYVRGFKLWIPSDCTAAESAVGHRRALSWMRHALKADTKSSASFQLNPHQVRESSED